MSFSPPPPTTTHPLNLEFTHPPILEGGKADFWICGNLRTKHPQPPKLEDLERPRPPKFEWGHGISSSKYYPLEILRYMYFPRKTAPGGAWFQKLRFFKHSGQWRSSARMKFYQKPSNLLVTTIPKAASSLNPQGATKMDLKRKKSTVKNNPTGDARVPKVWAFPQGDGALSTHSLPNCFYQRFLAFPGLL